MWGVMTFKSKVMDILKGTIIAVVVSFPVAILFALLFRLPIPLGGYIGPFGEIGVYDFGAIELFKAVFLAWIFYGMFGGFIILSVLGAITGVVASRKYSESVSIKNKMIVLWATTISAIPILLLSILDYIIGPW
jgi:hypothetical protein